MVPPKDEWWRRSRFLRAVYQPLLTIFDSDYREWVNSSKRSTKIVEEQMAEAARRVAPFGKVAQDFVGYGEVRDELLSAVEYWVLRDQTFRDLYPTPPPQVFILKGAGGMGKTSLAHSVMFDAFNRGKSKRVPVFAEEVSPHEILDKYLGESEKKIAAVFDRAFMRPTILFVDEAQTLAGEHRDSSPADEGGVLAYSGIQTTLLGKISEMTSQEKNCILILATDEFGSILEAVRRRGSAGTIDLDAEIDRPTLIEIVQKNLQRYGLQLQAEEVLRTIEARVRALGHGTVTPADIHNAFQIVMEGKLKPVRSSYLRKLSSSLGRETPKVQATLEDFRRISKLKEYDENRRSEEIRHIITRIRPEITFDDVGGLSGIKESLLKDVEVSLNRELSKEAGATPIRGVLLHGHPGTGKTWLAQAIAGELQATMYLLRGSQIMRPYHGQTERIITDLFDEARKSAPSIIIIDELDALTLRREMGGNLGAVTTLLSEMGGLKPLEGVVVIGTTNKLQLIDEAFLRAGRFDRVIEIPAPRNDAERIEIIRVHLRKCKAFLDPSVTEEKVLELFGKRTFTPARIQRIISDAIELRLKELNAASKLTKASAQDHTLLNKITRIYNDDLARVRSNLGLSAQPTSPGDQAIPSFENLRNITPDTYKLNMSHFRAAMALSKDEPLEEIQKVASSLRGPNPAPAVGKVYGLAALSGTNDGGATASEGVVAVIECVCNPYGKEGRADVVGSEIAQSVKASAEHARVFLNEECRWAIRNYEFFVDFITFAKGQDTQVIQGPSAGAAITLAQYSASANEEVLPNVVITGGITPKGELVQVGGLDFRGMGKFIAALNTDGVDTMVIPASNYTSLSTEDVEFFQRKGLKIVPASVFWDVAKIALVSHPDKQTAIDKLGDRAKQGS